MKSDGNKVGLEEGDKNENVEHAFQQKSDTDTHKWIHILISTHSLIGEPNKSPNNADQQALWGSFRKKGTPIHFPLIISMPLGDPTSYRIQQVVPHSDILSTVVVGGGHKIGLGKIGWVKTAHIFPDHCKKTTQFFSATNYVRTSFILDQSPLSPIFCDCQPLSQTTTPPPPGSTPLPPPSNLNKISQSP